MARIIAAFALAGLAGWSPAAQAQAQIIYSAVGTEVEDIYGPVTICMEGYAIRIAADEGVRVGILDGRIRHVRILTDTAPSVALDFDRGDGALKVRRSTIRVSGVGAVTRNFFPEHSGYRDGIPGEIVEDTIPPATDYTLPARPGGSALRVRTPSFVGSAGDKQVFARFSLRTATTVCDDPKARPDWGKYGGGTSLRRVVGPGFACSGRVGLPLLAGETARFSWRDGKSFTNYISVSGAGFGISVWTRYDPADLTRPVGNLIAIGFTLRPSDPYDPPEAHSYLLPPRSYPRTASDLGELDFTTGLEGAERDKLLARFEYIHAGDPRCSVPTLP